MGVNALACGPKQVEDPAYRAGIWPTALGEPGNAPSARERVPAELAPLWQADIGRAPAGPPALGDTLLAVQSVNGRLTVLHAETGRLLWERDLGRPTPGGPLLVQSRLYAVTGGDRGSVYALDVRRGRTIWQQELGPLAGTAALGGARVVVVTEDGAVIALETRDGTVAWRRRIRGPVWTGAAISGDRVVVAAADSIHLLALDDGRPLATTPAAGPTVARPAAAGDTLVVTSPDGRITALALADLATLWSVDVESPAFGPAAIARDTVFAVTLEGRLWRIPLAAPQRASSLTIGRAMRAGPAPVANGVVVATVRGDILVVRDGVVTQPQLRVDGPLEHPPLVRRGILLIVDGRGKIRTWR